MSVWLTEQEFRNSDAESVGVTLNVAFLQDIKQDVPSIRSQTDQIRALFVDDAVTIREQTEQLTHLRDELETYFALEEFYGYFSNATEQNPGITTAAEKLRGEHEQLFVQLNQIVELAEQIMYEEKSGKTIEQIADHFDQFANHLAAHEQREMELMMRLCNEELGVGD